MIIRTAILTLFALGISSIEGATAGGYPKDAEAFTDSIDFETWSISTPAGPNASVACRPGASAWEMPLGDWLYLKRSASGLELQDVQGNQSQIISAGTSCLITSSRGFRLQQPNPQNWIHTGRAWWSGDKSCQFFVNYGPNQRLYINLDPQTGIYELDSKVSSAEPWIYIISTPQLNPHTKNVKTSTPTHWAIVSKSNSASTSCDQWPLLGR